MKKNSSQWSMSKPDGDAVCHGDEESLLAACTTHGSSPQRGTPLLEVDVSWPSHRGQWWTHRFCWVGVGARGIEAEYLPAARSCSFPSAPAPPLVVHLVLAFSVAFSPFEGLESSLGNDNGCWHFIHLEYQAPTIRCDPPLVPLVRKRNLTLHSLSALEVSSHVASPSLAPLAFYNHTSLLS